MLFKTIRVVGITLFALLIMFTVQITTALAYDPDSGPVIITEFMASNEITLPDEDGDYSDWIELHNSGSTEINLDGFYLTDEDELTKWQFPTKTLGAGDYLVIFASDKDRSLAGSELHTNFKLKAGGEYLALVQPDGTTISWEYAPEYPPQSTDISYGLDGTMQERYFNDPTPGSENGTGLADLGPTIASVTYNPSLPTANDPLTVTAEIRPLMGAIEAVQLTYRVMFGDEMILSMFDDGANGDGQAGDNIYSAVIPSSAYQAGEMVRYFIHAEDSDGYTSRQPLFRSPNDSPEYQGTMITDSDTTSSLPILYWFVEDTEAAKTRDGTRATVYYNGVLYDNIFVRLRGGSTALAPKKSFKFDFNKGDYFTFSSAEAPVEEFNLNSTASDPSYIRQILSWETYRDVGVPYSIAFPMRVQQNGDFHSVAIFIEQPDSRYLERQDFDPDGALYKFGHINGVSSSTISVEKKSRREEDNSDLQALIDGIHLSGVSQSHYLFDNLSIPPIINYLAATILINDSDHVCKNFYLYRDTEGTGEWMVLPWDKDLTFRTNWVKDELVGHPLYGTAGFPGLFCGDPPEWNHMIDAVLETPSIREMYLRRLRTLMDEVLQPTGAQDADLYFEPRIDALSEQMQADILLDAAIWSPSPPFSDALNDIKTNFLPLRREHLFETHGPTNAGLIPDSQPPAPLIRVGPNEVVSLMDNQNKEYFTLLNPNSYAVDISGWAITGALAYTFQSGVVIPAGGMLYLSPDIVTFRNRDTSPTGGESLFVQGNYEGRLSIQGGLVELRDAQGRLISSMTVSAPSSPYAQQLHITELNYHPPDEGETDGNEFEFLELKNSGKTAVDLNGFAFIDGIDYEFASATVLEPGELTLLVRNETEFTKRYPGIDYAGVYDGKLSNGGEQLTFVDNEGGIISSFEYDDKAPWPELPDGDGYTLVRREPLGDPNHPCWWRSSTNLFGSPGADDPPGGHTVCTDIYLPVTCHAGS